MYSLETLQFEQLLELFVRHCRTPLGADRLVTLSRIPADSNSNAILSAVAETIELAKEDAGWYFSELADPFDRNLDS